MYKGKKRGRKCPPRKEDKRMDRSERMDEERPSRDARNDISWYSKYPNLLLAAGSFPYPYRPGMSIKLGQLNTGETYGVKQLSTVIPGVLTLDWMPSIGYSQSATDPASILAKEMYARVREKYSGSLEADAPDFVVYVMALDSIFSYLAWLKRLYRVMNAWTPENYVLPDVVLAAMNLSDADIQSLRQNRTRLWQCINELILMSRKFTCPAVMDIFNRHYWMSDNVYTDDATINSQFYLFNLKAVYQYAPQNMPSGDPASGLKAVLMPTWSNSSSTALTVDALYQFGRGLIDSLVEWDDAYTINGYLLRAYEGTPNFIVDELPQDQPFNPVYEPEVLAQIENSRVVPMGDRIGDLSSFNVSQNVVTNAVLSNPSYTVESEDANVFTAQSWNIPPVLSVRSMTPTVADSTVSSRLQSAVKSVTSPSTGKWTVTVTAGTEIPLCWRLTYQVGGRNSSIYSANAVNQIPVFMNSDSATATSIWNVVNSIFSALWVEQFDWHPFIFLSLVNNTTLAKGATQVRVVGDTHNVTTITVDDLSNLHKICIYSELNSFIA